MCVPQRRVTTGAGRNCPQMFPMHLVRRNISHGTFLVRVICVPPTFTIFAASFPPIFADFLL